MKVDIKDNSKLFLEEFQNKVEQALLTIGENAQGFAVDDCPVDTGRLRNSINYAVIVPEKTVYLGTDVEYAKYVEFGDNAHHATGKAHFLRDAATTHNDLYKEIAKAALKD